MRREKLRGSFRIKPGEDPMEAYKKGLEHLKESTIGYMKERIAYYKNRIEVGEKNLVSLDKDPEINQNDRRRIEETSRGYIERGAEEIKELENGLKEVHRFNPEEHLDKLKFRDSSEIRLYKM